MASSSSARIVCVCVCDSYHTMMFQFNFVQKNFKLKSEHRILQLSIE